MFRVCKFKMSENEYHASLNIVKVYMMRKTIKKSNSTSGSEFSYLFYILQPVFDICYYGFCSTFDTCSYIFGSTFHRVFGIPPPFYIVTYLPPPGGLYVVGCSQRTICTVWNQCV